MFKESEKVKIHNHDTNNTSDQLDILIPDNSIDFTTVFDDDFEMNNNKKVLCLQAWLDTEAERMRYQHIIPYNILDCFRRRINTVYEQQNTSYDKKMDQLLTTKKKLSLFAKLLNNHKALKQYFENNDLGVLSITKINKIFMNYAKKNPKKN